MCSQKKAVRIDQKHSVPDTLKNTTKKEVERFRSIERAASEDSSNLYESRPADRERFHQPGVHHINRVRARRRESAPHLKGKTPSGSDPGDQYAHISFLRIAGRR